MSSDIKNAPRDNKKVDLGACSMCAKGNKFDKTVIDDII